MRIDKILNPEVLVLYFKSMFFRLFCLCAFAWFLEGCTCCAYLNHMFNAERAYEEAEEMRTARLDSTANEESKPVGEESKKYDRVIEKGSRVLERFPKNKKRSSDAVFLIAESYRHKGEWGKAVEKYDELERYFPEHDSMEAAQYQRAYCLYKNKEFNISRFALEPVIEKGKEHPYYFQGLNLLSLLEEVSEDPGQAIAALEKLLADTAGTPFMRGKAHFRLATLYYAQGTYEKARENYLAKEIQELQDRDRYTAATQAAECLANREQYEKAAEEYLTAAKNPDYQSRLSLLLVRYGELLFLAKKYSEGIAVFQKVTTDFPKTEEASRAYYQQGFHEQEDTKAYEVAMLFYDSSYVARPPSKWGKESKERYDALKQLLILQGNNDAMDSVARTEKPFFDNEFQIAELFLFKLSESDSAIARLNGIIENSDDSLKVLRAAYARAFIYDEFLNDPETAEEYYMEIMEKYPDSEYAKQAQVNLGMRVTLKTQEDLAHDKFLAAESLWLEAKALPLEMMDAVDSAYAKALNAYDSVYLEFPKTNAGIQALYMSAMLYSSFPSGLDSAAAKLRLIRDVAPTSPWGKSAAVMLSGRVSISDEDLIRMRKRIEQNEVRSSELSKQYYDSFKQEKKEDKVEVKSKEEEILENTYNSMYDFE